MRRLGLDPDRAVELINAAETKAKLRANPMRP